MPPSVFQNKLNTVELASDVMGAIAKFLPKGKELQIEVFEIGSIMFYPKFTAHFTFAWKLDYIQSR